MIEFITAIATAIATFIATNLDDILILTLFFAQVGALFRRRQIVLGQYLGFILLVLASLPGFFGSFLIPTHYLKGLGVIPIILGITYLLKREEEETESLDAIAEQNNHPSWLKGWLSPQVYGVAAVTVANGSDNISVYLPLFASSTGHNLVIIVATFLLLVGVWCFVAYRLTHVTAIADWLKGYGDTLVPCVLIGLGVFIIKENLPLAFLALIISYFWAMSLNSDSLLPEDET
ncbi:cadmium resistance transporter [Rippkaea orientalis PCC 8801]|uniref:Cadmium resistance transporter n=1 Tax=Rippkaea orientalis (strain PCC 8801 / RF-1) TaxID=41431 RepID=B7JWI5_RIPO1|nr:cadmium resistance transporter [Rippkaea orientalis]ACK68326.1 cadmium resistance transporter [Rippkaea orientalis PCC 8801]